MARRTRHRHSRPRRRQPRPSTGFAAAGSSPAAAVTPQPKPVTPRRSRSTSAWWHRWPAHRPVAVIALTSVFVATRSSTPDEVALIAAGSRAASPYWMKRREFLRPDRRPRWWLLELGAGFTQVVSTPPLVVGVAAVEAPLAGFPGHLQQRVITAWSLPWWGSVVKVGAQTAVCSAGISTMPTVSARGLSHWRRCRCGCLRRRRCGRRRRPGGTGQEGFCSAVETRPHPAAWKLPCVQAPPRHPTLCGAIERNRVLWTDGGSAG